MQMNININDVTSLISAVSWPITTVWCAYIFRSEIRSLATRVSHLKYKDVEATFEKELSKTEAKVNAITINKNVIAPSSELQDKIDQLQRIANLSPRAAILESWILIEHAAGKSGFIQGAKIPRINSLLFVDWLIREGKLPHDSIDAVSALRELRNQAAHLPDFSIAQEDAERYISLAAKISTLIINAD